MDDAFLDLGLVDQQVNVNELGIDANKHLHESKQERNVRAIPMEQLSLVVRELHNNQPFSHLRMQEQVESNRTRKLDQEHVEIRCEVQAELRQLTLDANDHDYLAAHHHDGGVQVLALLRRRDQVLVHILLEVAQHRQGHEVLPKLHMVFLNNLSRHFQIVHFLLSCLDLGLQIFLHKRQYLLFGQIDVGGDFLRCLTFLILGAALMLKQLLLLTVCEIIETRKVRFLD